MQLKYLASAGFIALFSLHGNAQVLKLEDALQRAVEQYDKIKSKQALVLASTQNTHFQKQNYLPDLTVAAQQSFGTINAQNGPMYAYGGMASAATSMPLSEQNWNAAFGSLYFVNVNWNLFTFGKIQSHVDLGTKKEFTAKADLEQEIFQHQIKVSAAYLNLLASQRLKYVQEKNTDRAQVFFEMTTARANSGLIADVDAQLAKAEVSNAKSLQLKAYDKELEFSKQLSILMNDDFKTYEVDKLYSTTVPQILTENSEVEKHPFLDLQQSKIDESLQSEELFKVQKRPTISAFGVLQGRGSGFDYNYVQDNSAYSSNYLKGVGIDRGNYILGLSLSWNLTNILRSNTQIKEQQFKTQALQYDFDLAKKELNAQSKMAKAQLQNAFDNFEETKIQLAAAEMAYKQHTALYENGLSTLVDFTQALYSLNRAEIDYEIAQNNVWQTLLLQASSQGDLKIFTQNH